MGFRSFTRSWNNSGYF